MCREQKCLSRVEGVCFPLRPEPSLAEALGTLKNTYQAAELVKANSVITLKQRFRHPASGVCAGSGRRARDGVHGAAGGGAEGEGAEAAPGLRRTTRSVLPCAQPRCEIGTRLLVFKGDSDAQPREQCARRGQAVTPRTKTLHLAQESIRTHIPEWDTRIPS